MRYPNNLILLVFCLLCAAPALAQDTRYRVEILLLSHLDHAQQPAEQLRLQDYSPAIDFLTPPPEEDEEAQVEEEQESESETMEDIVDEAGQEPDPNAVVHVEEMTDVMQEAWRRLRLSGPFRPEQYLSWEQGSEAPFPALRIHDLEVVLTLDPYAELRQQLLEQETTPVFADAAGLDELDESSEPELPQPTVFYRLDGTVTLKRSRFLHLELDLQLREPVWDPATDILPITGTEEEAPREPSAFLTYDLEQSRQVKTGRMEYFDSPVLGVLAYITTIEIPEEESQ